MAQQHNMELFNAITNLAQNTIYFQVFK